MSDFEERAVRMFKRIYPEDEIRVLQVGKETPFACSIKAGFPDGVFWFIVTEHTVSSAFETRYEAIKGLSI